MVVAIIGVLVSLLLPAVQAARESARLSQCKNNLRQIGLALHTFHDAKAAYPIGCVEKRTAKNQAARQLAWTAELLPFLEHTPLWRAIDFSTAYDSVTNSHAAATTVSAYLCPSTARRAPGRDADEVADAAGEYRAAAIDYGGNYGAAFLAVSANGVLLYDRAIAVNEVTDGLSQTVAVWEDVGRGWLMNGEWINGENIFDVNGSVAREQDNEIWSDHPEGAMALRCDGGVWLLSSEADVTVIRNIATRSGDEVSVAVSANP